MKMSVQLCNLFNKVMMSWQVGVNLKKKSRTSLYTFRITVFDETQGWASAAPYKLTRLSFVWLFKKKNSFFLNCKFILSVRFILSVGCREH